MSDEPYSLTMRKKANFARNARHWKHGLGGNLFSGEEEGSQQMNRANIFRRPNGEYFYQASPDSEEITVTPLNTIFENPALWTYTDANGKLYSPRQTVTSTQGAVVKKEDEGPIVEAAKNYLGELQYDINNGIPIGGKYTMPAIAAAAALPVVGEVAAPILANPYVDAGLTSAFAGHGLNHTINEGIDGLGDAAMTALEIAPLGRLTKPMWDAGKGTIAEIQALYNNYPIRNYNIDAILKSDFYNKISEQYGKELADDLAQKLTSKEFRNYLFGDNPRKAFKDADRHLKQMQFIKDVENAGGLLGGSGQLAKAGTVNREGLMHDIDFFIPGSMTDKTSPVFDALGYTTYADPAINNMTLFGTGFHRPVKPQIIMGSPEKGYINMPKERYGMTADMFIREQMPSNEEATNVILSAKRLFGRPKDLADIEAFKPYSSTNPIIDISTGQGQWNPTLFDKGIFTKEGYPFVQSVETYPGSGVRVPAVMNYKGEIRSIGRPSVTSTTQQITAENAANSEILQNAFENQPRSIGNIIRGMKEPESMLTPEQNARISKYANNLKDPSIQMDERLAAGGADRLKVDDRVVYHDYPAVITEYVPTDNRTFLPQIQEAIKQAQNTYGRRLTNEEIIGIADEISAGKSFAIKDTPYGFVRETLPRVRKGIEKGHEKSHIKVSPKTYSSPLPKDFLEAKWGKDNYMVKNNGDEQLPRLSQIKAYYGKDEISAEELMYASENYVKDTKVDNNMTDFFDAIKEYAKQHPEIWEEMAKYGSEAAPIGLSLLYLNKD